jgi:hypothetical protein
MEMRAKINHDKYKQEDVLAKSEFGVLCYLNTSLASLRCFGISPFLQITTGIISIFRPFGALPIRNYKLPSESRFTSPHASNTTDRFAYGEVPL